MSNDYAAMLFTMMPVNYVRNFETLTHAHVQAERDWQQAHNFTVLTQEWVQLTCLRKIETGIQNQISILLV